MNLGDLRLVGCVLGAQSVGWNQQGPLYNRYYFIDTPRERCAQFTFAKGPCDTHSTFQKTIGLFNMMQICKRNVSFHFRLKTWHPLFYVDLKNNLI